LLGSGCVDRAADAEFTRGSAKQGIVRRSPAPLTPKRGMTLLPEAKRRYVVALLNGVDVVVAGKSRKKTLTVEMSVAPPYLAFAVGKLKTLVPFTFCESARALVCSSVEMASKESPAVFPEFKWSITVLINAGASECMVTPKRDSP